MWTLNGGLLNHDEAIMLCVLERFLFFVKITLVEESG